jgi:hypothetical protein
MNHVLVSRSVVTAMLAAADVFVGAEKEER